MFGYFLFLIFSIFLIQFGLDCTEASKTIRIISWMIVAIGFLMGFLVLIT